VHESASGFSFALVPIVALGVRFAASFSGLVGIKNVFV
jgi:hypothetical protein